MKTALTIAGTDPTGGAGIQADLKTMTMNGVFGMSAITALVSQNTMGVREIVEMTPDFLASQIDVVFEDIVPDAVKIGMVASTDLIRTIARQLQFHRAKNIVVDPVMVATSGDRLISEDAIETLKEELLPMACVITPNIPEAEILAGMKIAINDANDYLYDHGTGTWFTGRRINNPNTHGTGCTLSSAIASNLAKGFDLRTSIQRSKDYLSGALEAMLNLGQGRGPMMHNFNLTGEFRKEA